jgi:hypothetical protein
MKIAFTGHRHLKNRDVAWNSSLADPAIPSSGMPRRKLFWQNRLNMQKSCPFSRQYSRCRLTKIEISGWYNYLICSLLSLTTYPL